MDFQLVFKNFVGREQLLRKINRYNMYSLMFYRSNLFTHSKRVSWLVREISAVAINIWPEFDQTKAQIMAAIHDDHEIIMGDVQAGNKSKMTEGQLANLHLTEVNAIGEVSKMFPQNVGDYNYKDLLLDILETKSLEAKVVKYVDKMDAFCEAMHEILAGNVVFATNVTNEYGTIPIPTDYYIKYFSSFLATYPQLQDLFITSHPMLRLPAQFDARSLVTTGVPHSSASISEDSIEPHYNFWKKVILDSNDQEEIQNLYIQKEFLYHLLTTL